CKDLISFSWSAVRAFGTPSTVIRRRKPSIRALSSGLRVPFAFHAWSPSASTSTGTYSLSSTRSHFLPSYGLLYEWTGSDASPKPVLLRRRPCRSSTVESRVHPPYSGHFDSGPVSLHRFWWGRGTADNNALSEFWPR
ncbi:hypothetical protein B0H17DRAFT_1340068, partial [Mycena rosella]